MKIHQLKLLSTTMNIKNSILNANIGRIETSGIDLNVHYATDFGWGIGSAGSTQKARDALCAVGLEARMGHVPGKVSGGERHTASGSVDVHRATSNPRPTVGNNVRIAGDVHTTGGKRAAKGRDCGFDIDIAERGAASQFVIEAPRQGVRV